MTYKRPRPRTKGPPGTGGGRWKWSLGLLVFRLEPSAQLRDAVARLKAQLRKQKKADKAAAEALRRQSREEFGKQGCGGGLMDQGAGGGGGKSGGKGLNEAAPAHAGEKRTAAQGPAGWGKADANLACRERAEKEEGEIASMQGPSCASSSAMRSPVHIPAT